MSMPVVSALDFTSNSMIDETVPDSTPMKDFYRNKTIFLTVGTGFLGQLYVEKLLRCRAKRVYLLTRPKKDKSSLQRIHETFDGDLFMRLQSIDKNYKNKITLVEGDLGSLKLGISESQRKELIDNVEIVLHASAEVRFDKTREIITLVKEIKNLIVFAYISTAYSHCPRDCIEEKFYPAPIDPDQMIHVAEHYTEKDSDTFNMVTSLIIKPWENTYVFTKALTEELVRRAAISIPTVVIRPSIIIATHEDPIPAWCNNTYGLNGVLVAVGLGFMRIIRYSKETESNIVCADFVTNATFAAIWDKANQRLNANDQNDVNGDHSDIIYHVTAKEDNLSWHEINMTMNNMTHAELQKGSTISTNFDLFYVKEMDF